MPDEFRPADYFFSFLEHARRHVDTELLEVLAQQYSDAESYSRNKLIRKLGLPSSYGARDALEYNLHLWNWQLGSASSGGRRVDGKKIDSLANTVELIRETVDAVEKSRAAAVERSGTKESCDMRWVPLNVDLAKDVVNLLRAASWFLYYVSRRTRLIQEEKREGRPVTDRILKELDEHWREGRRRLPAEWDVANTCNAIWADKSEPSRGRAGDEALKGLRDREAEIDELSRHLFIREEGDHVRSSDAHRLLLACVRYLPYVDMSTVRFASAGHGGGRREPTQTGIEFRVRESWSIDEFHANLATVFHVYLVNARRLAYPPEHLDYRYAWLGASGDRHLGTADGDGAVAGLKDLVCPEKERWRVGESRESPAGETKIRAGDCVQPLLEQVGRYRGRGGQHQMQVADFSLATRLIFMQWLSNDVDTKNRALNRIREGLEKLEVPFKAWLIEYNNHLFNTEWQLCLEPVLQRSSVKEMAKHAFRLRDMLHVSEQQFSWGTLAAAVSDPKMDRVRTEAERLAAVLRLYGSLPGVVSRPGRMSTWVLHYGDVLLATLTQSHQEQEQAQRSGEWRLETSHSAWRLNPTEQDRSAKRPPASTELERAPGTNRHSENGLTAAYLDDFSRFLDGLVETGGRQR